MKSELEKLAIKYKVAQSDEWSRLVLNYENGADILDALHNGMVNAAKTFWHESEKDENASKVFNIMLKEANLLSKLMPEMRALDDELNMLVYPNTADEDLKTKR